ncbi:glycosyl transferase [Anaerobacillus alkalidiazotrophicus]|uniref:Glycosyl transferase n=1 Tax=Anaerobacillus alkalidiazotrophicus TaxID=472963 RepID=A0A1S2MB05_9BACI|nr:glycosyltransferase family 2 protein [Anaerobacillus alkalidiazotrophicus]OIJ21754.1 glycosyl transferase [Anaerobacillus alkalidiazotrophicus]
MMSNQNESGNRLVSVITPTYNSAKFIGETIESVLAQTYTNWEMVIVDDCSSDETVRIVKEYVAGDNRIKLIQLKENSGPAIARNTAIEHACGRYLAFLDSDDQWLPHKLERQLQFMQEHEIAFSFTDYMNMNEDGTETGVVTHAPKEANYHQLLKHNTIGCLTVMLDTEKTGKVKMINIRTRQDYVLWLTICKQGFTAYGLQEVLANYRNVGNSVSNNKLKMAKQNWKVYRQIENISLVKSLWYFVHYVYFKLKKYVSQKVGRPSNKYSEKQRRQYE